MIDNFRRHRRICALVFLILLPACYNWQLAATTPVRQEDVRPGKVRITRTDGSRTVLHRVTVSSDTLVGFPQRPEDINRVQRVPLADITRVDTPEFDLRRTLGIGLGAVALASIIAVIAIMDSWSDYWGT
jgi:hypothetical protein